MLGQEGEHGLCPAACLCQCLDPVVGGLFLHLLTPEEPPLEVPGQGLAF